ncbi:zinc finger protein 277 isoform 6-T7 [Megaptera novaeangliae]
MATVAELGVSVMRIYIPKFLMSASCLLLPSTDSKDCILEPLSLPESPGGTTSLEGSPSVPCIFCEEHFLIDEQDKLLKHMIIEHKTVIADVKLVADFQRCVTPIMNVCCVPSVLWPLISTQHCYLYISYWRKRFTEQPITDFCSVIRINSTAPFEEQDNYFLLCDVLPEDRILREELQKQRLKEILEQQQQERNDNNFQGSCVFCNEEFLGNRSVLLNHMAREHTFNIGLPDNIVNCNEFLCTLQKKLDNLQCLYCEKTFRDKNTLKDHMRKKQHRRINPKNREYDRFYVINYLDAHEFDLLKIKSELGLNFYQQVKLVNFIRRQIHQCRCYGCHEKFKSKADLRTHMEEAKHTSLLPERQTWDQPQYYFPTYENDTLLCTLSDSESDLTAQEQNGSIAIISEDTSKLHALKQSSILNQLRLHESLKN